MHLYYLLCAAAVFLSAVLLGCLQPWLGKLILPRFDGTPAAWDATMAAYGGATLVGYLLGFLCTRLRSVRAQAVLSVSSWIVALLVVGIGFSEVVAEELPWFWLVPVGMLVVLCSANFLVLPSWVAALTTAEDEGVALDPYPLVAVSFLGSLVSLLVYLFAVEPFLHMRAQGSVWQITAACIGVLVTATAAYAWIMWHPADVPHARLVTPPPENGGLAGPIWLRYRWVLLSAMPTALGQATMTYVVTEVAPMPLFYLVPLALYTLTLVNAFSRVNLRPGFHLALSLAIQGAAGLAILCSIFFVVRAFDGPPLPASGWALLITSVLLFVPHRWTLVLQPLVTLAALAYYFAESSFSEPWPHPVSMALLVSALWLNSWGCHGVLAADRPPPAQIAEFLVWVVLGAALGGLINVLAPHIFTSTLFEYPLLLGSACVVRFLPLWRNSSPSPSRWPL